VPGSKTGVRGPKGVYIRVTGPRVGGWALGVRPAALPWKTPFAMKSQTSVTCQKKPKTQKRVEVLMGVVSILIL
jgi:hypothetical protein